MRIRATRWLVVAAAAGALLAQAGIAGAAPAPAPAGAAATAGVRAPAATGAAKSVPIVLHRANTTAAQAAAGPPVITCNAISDYPHNSEHVPGTINVVGRGECDFPVGTIDVVVGLFRGNSLVGTPGSRVQDGVASLSASSSTACVAGTYQGTADVIFTAPQGYSPPAVRLVGQSIPVAITC